MSCDLVCINKEMKQNSTRRAFLLLVTCFQVGARKFRQKISQKASNWYCGHIENQWQIPKDGPSEDKTEVKRQLSIRGQWGGR